MAITEEEVGVVIVAVGRTFRVTEARRGWVQVRVESNQRRILYGGHFAKRNELAGAPHIDVLNGPLIPATIDVATHAELGFGANIDAPIIYGQREPGSFANAIRIVYAVLIGGAESVIDVGIPGGVGQRRRAHERLAVVSHQTQQTGRPDVIKSRSGGERPGELTEIAHVHGVRYPNLFQIINAGNLLGFTFGPGQGGKQHGRENGNDGDDDQQFDEREAFLSCFLQ